MEYRSCLEELLRCHNKHIALRRAGLATQARVGVDLVSRGANVLLVAQNRDEMGKLYALIPIFTAERITTNVLANHIFNNIWITLPPFTSRSLTKEGWAERIAALYALKYGKAQGLILTADTLLHKYIPLDFFDNHVLHIRTGEELSPDILLEQTVNWGYDRVSMVSNPGEVARRGDIFDIMPPGYHFPLRLDFFGEVIEEIRFFDPSTQRSKGYLDEIVVLPVTPVRSDIESKALIESHWNKLVTQGVLTENEQYSLFRLLEEKDPRLLPGCCYDNATVIEEWLSNNSISNNIWLLPSLYEIEDILISAENSWKDVFHEQNDEGSAQPIGLALRTSSQVKEVWSQSTVAHTEPLVIGFEQEGIDLPEKTISSFQTLFPTPSEQERPWQNLIQSIRKWQKEKHQLILSFVSERSRNKFLNLAEQDGIMPLLHYSSEQSGVFAIVSPFRSGVDLLWRQTLILGEDVLQPHTGKSRHTPSESFKGLNKYDDLSPGDLLVHKNYGISRFGGLVRMDIGSISNDFLLLEYAGDDKLYLPVDRLSLIQRFKSASDDLPQLDRLGSTSWQASKDRIRKSIEKVAEDIIEMYAWRKVAKGFTYPPLGELYREFEASFGFEETPDQARAIQEVLADMEKSEPMDRLVCGDVGFGKTEVALRAAFRAASEGRQVALLCPTTVLAEQHYYTFRSRLSGFAITVGLLSRFVPASKQKEIRKAAANGQIDILVGTHKLLSDTVSLPNLGLLILDEEQRFGVKHKEKLKKMKKNVDVLTLTATPIPRTLQLSMSGVCELSVIETPPPDRKPVSTAIIKRDKNKLKEIVERELAREGQVFWVHNRVQGLEQIVNLVKELVPYARVGIAHGQMPEKQLEENIHAFWHGEIDLLVCTAIIESGLDFPRANTLIVDQAHMFGLGQLYQLRGRVGRSDRQAFAVFVVSDLEMLSENARERLKIILDLDYLGAGLQVAMEDLRIRGAGNILGEAQSGHMSRVGIELYLEMLEEAVAKRKGEGISTLLETELTLGLTAHIPESYITDSHERLRWYKSLSSAQSVNARNEIELELRDRFGPLPQELKTFIAVLNFKNFLTEIQIIKAEIFEDKVKLIWPEKQTIVSLDNLIAFIEIRADRVKLSPPATLEIKLNLMLEVDDRFRAVQEELTTMLHKSTIECTS